jgi:hypothetical protein
MRARGSIVVLCTTHHDAPVLYIRKTSHHRSEDASERKAGPPWRGGYRRARLDEIVTRRNPPTALAMLQMGVFFAEGMCFDTPMEGNGGPSQAASPIV